MRNSVFPFLLKSEKSRVVSISQSSLMYILMRQGILFQAQGAKIIHLRPLSQLHCEGTTFLVRIKIFAFQLGRFSAPIRRISNTHSF